MANLAYRKARIARSYGWFRQLGSTAQHALDYARGQNICYRYGWELARDSEWSHDPAFGPYIAQLVDCAGNVVASYGGCTQADYDSTPASRMIEAELAIIGVGERRKAGQCLTCGAARGMAHHNNCEWE